MLEKTVKIGDTDVKFRSSASVPRLYRIKFGRDIFKDLSRERGLHHGFPCGPDDPEDHR